MSHPVARLARRLPWPLKAGLKIMLTRTTATRSIARGLGGFDHGPMDDPAYVEAVVRGHLGRLAVTGLQDTIVLELGPGDSVASALVASGLGARRILLVDVDSFADQDVDVYVRIAGALRANGLAVPDISSATSLTDVLQRCRAEYLTDGVRSLSALPAKLVDVSWSQAVLEHVPLDDVDELLGQLFRVHAPGSRSSHRIDLRDHLASGLNNLRFSPFVWESSMVRSAGFYTNRIRGHEWSERFQAKGWKIEDMVAAHWPEPPVPRHRLAEPFSTMSDDELRVSSVDVVLSR